jgi:hypothetical protein
MRSQPRHRVVAIVFDMQNATEGDYGDFRRAVDRLEVDFPGTMLLSTGATHGWPIVVLHEAVCRCDICARETAPTTSEGDE